MLLAVLLSGWVASRVTRPVEQLAQAAREVAASLAPGERAELKTVVESLRDALLTLLRREAQALKGAAGEACRNTADFTQLEPPISFSAVRMMAPV